MSAAPPGSPGSTRGESLRQRWTRRSITLPLYLGMTIVGTALLPLLAIVSLAIDGATRRKLVLTRTLLFVVFYLWCENLAMIVAMLLWLALRLAPGFGPTRFVHASWWIQQIWANTLFAVGRRLFRLEIEIEGEEVVERVARSGPVLVFMRHTSTADTMLPAVLISYPHKILLRYVMKRELLWDPCIDVYGQRLPNVFVQRGSANPEAQIETVRGLCRDLSLGDGILIYPEGTRFTPAKRERILQKIESGGDLARLDRSRALRHVLPPKIGGPLAAIEENPEAVVLFCAHTGFDGIRTIREFLNGKMVGATIRAFFWSVPVPEIPTDPADRVDWLFDEWQEVDRRCAPRSS